MEVHIRRAEQRDCPDILNLVRELALYERAPEEVTVSLEHFEKSGFGPTPVWWAFVAESGGMIQGFALYYIRFSTWKGQRMYLEDLYVREEMRGKGIGDRLFQQLLREKTERGLNGMMWQVLEWNAPAINFYKKYESHFDAEWINCSIA